MSFSVDDIAQSIFQKPLGACTEPELRQFADAHPYFAPAQLLLTCALQHGPSTTFQEQVQTTSLYFPNRLWLEHILTLAGEGQDTEWVEHPLESSGVNPALSAELSPKAEMQDSGESATAALTETAPSAAVIPVETSTETTSTAETLVYPVAEYIVPPVIETEANAPAWPEAEDTHPVSQPEASEMDPLTALVPEETTNEEALTAEAPVNEVTDDTVAIGAETETSPPAEAAAPVHLPAASVTETWPADENQETKPQQTAPQIQPAEAVQPYPTEEPMSQPATEVASVADNHAQATTVAPKTGDLLFEPYHTVDYFASQGIRFRDDDKAKDRFSQQLRSFTEWLKVMKRISPAEMAASGEGAGERKVEQLAEHSLAERHVITEAMAEVWAKQGNRARAEEIYRKLSLLEPAKSSYFAAKIEELKK